MRRKSRTACTLARSWKFFNQKSLLPCSLLRGSFFRNKLGINCSKEKLYLCAVFECEPHIILGMDRHKTEESMPKGWLEFVHQGFLSSKSVKEGFNSGLPGLLVAIFAMTASSRSFTESNREVKLSRETIVLVIEVALLKRSERNGILFEE